MLIQELHYRVLQAAKAYADIPICSCIFVTAYQDVSLIHDHSGITWMVLEGFRSCNVLLQL